jgi:hypothetical protein
MTDKELDFPANVVLQKVDRNDLVKRVQEWLCFQNYKTSIDRDFGDSTETQVNAFRKANGKPQNGKVDAALFKILSDPMARALTDIPPGNKTINDLSLRYAKQHLKEHPVEVGGDNRGPWVRLYCMGDDGADYRWCAGFATLMVKHGALTAEVPMPVTRTLSCDTLATRSQNVGRFVRGSDGAPTNIQPGDLFLVRRSSTDWSHTGMVSAMHATTFDTIEGNTNDEGSVNGYEVCARNRAFSLGIDFIRIS